MSKEYYEEHKNDYFDYKGVRYYTGTKFKMKHPIYKALEVEAVFNGYSWGNEQVIDVFYCDHNDMGNERKNGISIKKEDIDKTILEICNGNYYAELAARKKYRKDSEMPEVKMGWIMYIFVMCGLVIFKHAWAGWIAATIYFFRWRKKKMEEEYYYD